MYKEDVRGHPSLLYRTSCERWPDFLLANSNSLHKHQIAVKKQTLIHCNKNHCKLAHLNVKIILYYYRNTSAALSRTCSAINLLCKFCLKFVFLKCLGFILMSRFNAPHFFLFFKLNYQITLQRTFIRSCLTNSFILKHRLYRLRLAKLPFTHPPIYY